MDDLLGQTEEDRDDDGRFEGFTKHDEENGNGEEILPHVCSGRATEGARKQGPGWGFEAP